MHTLRHVSRLLSLSSLKTLYYTLIYPHLIYALPVWGTSKTNATYMAPIFRAQKKIMRIITRSRPRTHSAPIFKRLSILNIFQLYSLRVTMTMHPHVYPPKPKKATAKRPIISKPNHKPHHNHKYHFISQHQHATRLAGNSTLAPSQQTLSTQEAVTEWNNLPSKLRNIKLPTTFKKQVVKHLLEQ